MSRNKYKNNDLRKQSSQSEPQPNKTVQTEEDYTSGDIFTEPAAESDFEPTYSELLPDRTLPGLDRPGLNRIPDAIEQTEASLIKNIEDKPVPGESKFYPEGTDPLTGGNRAYDAGEPSNIAGSERDDQTIDSRYYAEPIDPYTGDKFNDVENGREEAEFIPENISKFEPKKDSTLPDKSRNSFPWWWILLPLILLILIYVLTQKPSAALNTPQWRTAQAAVTELSALPAIAGIGQLS